MNGWRKNWGQGDLPFRSINHIFRYASGFTAISIVCPAFGQIQFPIQKAVKTTSSVIQMYSNNTVVFLSGIATPLPLDTWSFITFFGMAGLVCFELFGRLDSTEAAIKLSQVLVQHRFQLFNLFGVHVISPFRIRVSKRRYRLVA